MRNNKSRHKKYLYKYALSREEVYTFIKLNIY